MRNLMSCKDMITCDVIFDNYREQKKSVFGFETELHRKKLSYLLFLEMVKLWSVTSSSLSLTKVGETL